MDKAFNKLDQWLGIDLPGGVDRLLGIDIFDNSEARANTKRNQDIHQRSQHRSSSRTRQPSNRSRSVSEPSRLPHRHSDQLDRAADRQRGRKRRLKCVGFCLPGEPERGDSVYPQVVVRIPWKDYDPKTGVARRASRSQSRDRGMKSKFSSDNSSFRQRGRAHTFPSPYRGRQPGDERDAGSENPRRQTRTTRRAYSSPAPPILRNRLKDYNPAPSSRAQSGGSAQDGIQSFGNERDADWGFSRHRPKTQRHAHSSPPPPTERNRHDKYHPAPSSCGQSGASAQNGLREFLDEQDANKEYSRHGHGSRNRAYSSPPPPTHRNRNYVYESASSYHGSSAAGAKDIEHRPRYPPARHHQNASAWSDEYHSVRGRDSLDSKPRYFRDHGDDVELGKKVIFISSHRNTSRDGNTSQRYRRSATF